MKRIATDRVVIVGAGLGALYAALSLAPHPVLILSPEVLGRGASSAWAQGGVAAAMSLEDSAERHAADTVRAGAGIVDLDVAAFVAAEARDHILALTTLGTPFDRTADGGYVLSREAAHSIARVVRVRGDQAGAEVMRALVARARLAAHIQLLEGVKAVGLQTDAATVTGVEVVRTGQMQTAPCLITGNAYLLAGGGSCGLFAQTTNPPRIRGEVIGMAARAGAVIADAEFVQFHPTAIDCGADPMPLATEALRGEGSHLVNRSGERFMISLHPDAELAPRDVVARAIFAQTQARMGPMLDTRGAVGGRMHTEFPAVAAACARAGIDPVHEPIPVAAAAHYHMGGIATDADGRTSLGRLWACGEAASTGLHGANRLASNGLLEALVFGRRCAEEIAAELERAPAIARAVTLPDLPVAPAPDGQAISRLRKTMTDGAGVVRSGQGLRRALGKIAEIETAHPDCASLRNMTATATLIVASALARKESRGGHFRSDFPECDPLRATRSRMTLTDALAIRAEPFPEIA